VLRDTAGAIEGGNRLPGLSDAFVVGGLNSWLGAQMSERIDFDALDAQLLPRAEELIRVWLPHAKRIGSEMCVGDVRGESGESLKISLTKGCWKDFATGEGGPGLISLYAAIRGINVLTAARELVGGIYAQTLRSDAIRDAHKGPHSLDSGPECQDSLDRPSSQALEQFDGTHSRLGKPANVYWYCDAHGPLFAVCRYEPHDKKKEFVPWRWSTEYRRWYAKAPPKPRQLYRLDRILANPERRVLLVEGEKCVEIAELMFPTLIVTTWPGGADAIHLADLEPLRGRMIAAVWPDADKGGIRAGRFLADRLANMGCRVDENTLGVKLIDPRGQTEGWDIADAVESGWNAERILDWGREHRSIVVSADIRESASDAVLAGASASDSGERRNISRPSGSSAPAEVTSPKEQSRQLWLSRLRTDEDGDIIADEENTLLALEVAPELHELVRYNEFADCVEVRRAPPWREVRNEYPRQWSDDDRVLFQAWLQAHGISVRKASTVQDSVVAHAKRSTYHPVREYLHGLRWDGTNRLEGWLTTYLGAGGNEEYLRAIGPCFLISLVARVMRPGCKVDCVLVLEGPQGLQKSTAVRILASEPWFCDALPNLHSKDAAIQLQGRWIQELPELAAVGSSGIESVKAFISRAIDRYRPPYGRNAVDRPRHCVFIATTNLREYLPDKTGGRRFWPVRCRAINLEALARDREQLLAEALERYRKGEEWHLTQGLEVLAQQEQELRRQVSVHEGRALAYLDALLTERKKCEGTAQGCEVTMGELIKAAGIDVDRHPQMAGAMGTQLSAILARAGWERLAPKGGHPNRRQPYRYVGPDPETEDDGSPQ
jgi:predicted P-loop ATPase